MKKIFVVFLVLLLAISIFPQLMLKKVTTNSLSELPYFSKAKKDDYLLKNNKIAIIIGSENRNDEYAGKIIEAYTNDFKRNLLDNYKIYTQNKLLIPKKIEIRKNNESIEFKVINDDIYPFSISTVYKLKENDDYIEILNIIKNISSKDSKMLLKDIVSFNELFPKIIKTNENGKKLLLQEDFISYSFIPKNNLKIFRSMFTNNFSALIYRPFKINANDEIVFSRYFYISKDIEEVRKQIYNSNNMISGKILTKLNHQENIPIVLYDDNNTPISLNYTDKNGNFSFVNVKDGYYAALELEGFKEEKIPLTSNKQNLINATPLKSVNNFIWPLYLTDHTTSSVIFNWKTEIPATAKIDIYDGNKKIKSIFVNIPLSLQHVPITDLTPGKEYNYKLYINDYYLSTNAMISGHFKTKSLSEENLKFAIYGDTRTYHEWHKYVADTLAKDNPEFVINSGDLVEKGDWLDDWNSFFNEISNLAKNSIYYPLLGNHERNNSYYYQAFYLPKGSGDYNKRWYYFDYGKIRFIFLDSNAVGTQQLEKSQLKWLENILKNSSDKTVLVFYHHPFWNNCKGYNYGMESHLEELWRPLFEKYGVKAVFNGHVHSYERHEKNGIIYVITGGGGAPLEIEHREKLEPTTVKINYGTLHYVLAEVKNNRIIFTVKAVAKIKNKNNDRDLEKISEIIDTFEIPLK
ncbi:metallophosphoesterase [Marinitoga aeolica]|uniref:Metallophosphoesterase n=1 Tax=Marinitoga aeolica TaxID=2809031 RepID=A0ABY8PQP8_9BACT|nr:metallophosphoesterase [Marinitoga aeolica]WGS64964.1 metallophosphoesterase [Marinitoga aeolica]